MKEMMLGSRHILEVGFRLVTECPSSQCKKGKIKSFVMHSTWGFKIN